ncbi:MAG: hypothetical protein BJ554DRAFT_7104 [Olpidium bornovanus]|uniref:Uncharacterized protein n=1 Tax=Olpidium bornovanus TaxID=278681 RepID=A0A8H7ZX22_9FUNG|nr:MAG: hypothetical protein BJ554DRAFT_7104 [Olpidium bornovanus]
MHQLPIQQLFLVEEGRTVVATARSARMAVSAAQRWSASVRIEDALLPLGAALSISRLLWEGAADERKRKDVSFVTQAIDDIIAVYLAKVSVVNFRDESDVLAGGDAEADAEGDAAEAGADETNEEGEEDEGAIEFANGEGERTEGVADYTDEGRSGEDPAVEHAKGDREGTEAAPDETGEKSDDGTAVEDPKWERDELELAEKTGKRDGDERAEDEGTCVPPADGLTGKPKLSDAVQLLMALKSAGSITAVDLGRLVKIFADHELYTEGLCALASDAAAQPAFV